MSKLTKAQREFFTQFTANALTNLIVQGAAPEYQMQVLEIARAHFSENVPADLVESAGKLFLEQAGFATIKRVDAFLKSEEYAAVSRASSVVLTALEEEFGKALVDGADAVETAIRGSQPAPLEGEIL